MQTHDWHYEHSYSGISASGHARMHVGNIYNNVHQGKSRSISSGPDQSNEIEAPDHSWKPPDLIFAVPFPRDDDYVHRGTLVNELYMKLSVSTARVALIGLGGIG